MHPASRLLELISRHQQLARLNAGIFLATHYHVDCTAVKDMGSLGESIQRTLMLYTIPLEVST